MSKSVQPIFLLLTLLLLSTKAYANSDDQWIFRTELGDGRQQPTAIYLSWDYGAVLFRGSCAPTNSDFVLEYFGDGEVPLKPDSGPLQVSGVGTITLKTRLQNGVLEGRIKLDAKAMRALQDNKPLQIDAPNAMGEPWYVGEAEPLRKVMRLCSSS